MPEPYSDAARIVGERIVQARRARALSQEDVANLAEMHVTNYGKIERGRANPSLSTILRIATALDTDPADIVRGLTADLLPGRRHRLTAADLIRARDDRTERMH